MKNPVCKFGGTVRVMALQWLQTCRMSGFRNTRWDSSARECGGFVSTATAVYIRTSSATGGSYDVYACSSTGGYDYLPAKAEISIAPYSILILSQ